MEQVPGDTHQLINFNVLIALAAFVLVFLLLGIAELLARNAQTRTGAIVGLVCVLLLVAGLPVWGPLVYLLLASIGQNQHAFWSVAPWLVIVATFHFGGLFFIGSVLCALVYIFSPGGHREKWMRMQMCLTFLVVGMIIYIAIVLARSGGFRP